MAWIHGHIHTISKKKSWNFKTLSTFFYWFFNFTQNQSIPSKTDSTNLKVAYGQKNQRKSIFSKNNSNKCGKNYFSTIKFGTNLLKTQIFTPVGSFGVPWPLLYRKNYENWTFLSSLSARQGSLLQALALAWQGASGRQALVTSTLPSTYHH